MSMKFVPLINLKLLTTANSLSLSIAEHENFSAKDMNFMLSRVEHEKKFYNLGARCWLFLVWPCVATLLGLF